MEYCKIKFRFFFVLAFFGLCLTIPAPNPVVNRRSGARPNFEPETRAYMAAVAVPYNGSVFYGGTAYEITGRSLWTAVNNYVLGLKQIGWSKFVAVYPYVGGTSTANSKNLINPLTYTLAFYGGVTHGGEGISFSSSAYARPGLIPSSTLSLNSTHLSACVSSSLNSFVVSGVRSGANGIFFQAVVSSSASASVFVNSSACGLSVNPPAGKDYVLNRNSSTFCTYYGTSISFSVSCNSTILPLLELQINGFNNSGVSSFASASSHHLYTVGFGLTENEILLLRSYNIAFRTSLNR